MVNQEAIECQLGYVIDVVKDLNHKLNQSYKDFELGYKSMSGVSEMQDNVLEVVSAAISLKKENEDFISDLDSSQTIEWLEEFNNLQSDINMLIDGEVL